MTMMMMMSRHSDLLENVEIFYKKYVKSLLFYPKLDWKNISFILLIEHIIVIIIRAERSQIYWKYF